MTTISIPTADELESRLGGIDRLLTATKWEKAAIVWAFTTNDGAGRPANGRESDHFPMPMKAFAKRGYVGLTTFDTVEFYRHQWQKAINQSRAKPVRPGEAGVELPDLEWPPSLRTQTRDNQPDAEELKAAAKEAGIQSTTVLDIASNKVAMEAAITGSPAVFKVAEKAVKRVRDQQAQDIQDKYARIGEERFRITDRVSPERGQFIDFTELLSDFSTLERVFPKVLRKMRDLPLEQVQRAFQGRAHRIEKWATVLREMLDGDPEFEDELNAMLSSDNYGRE